MSSGGKSDNSVLKCSPNLEGKVDLLSREADIFVQVKNSSGRDEIGVKKPRCGVCLDQSELGSAGETTQECPVSGGRGLHVAGPQDEDLLDLVRRRQGFDQFEDLGGGGDEGAEH